MYLNKRFKTTSTTLAGRRILSEFVKQNIFLQKYILENFFKLLYICLLINFNSVVFCLFVCLFVFKRYNKHPFNIFKSVTTTLWKSMIFPEYDRKESRLTALLAGSWPQYFSHLLT